MGDIDLLVDKSDFVRAFEALKNAGYTPKNTLENHIRHISFTSPEGEEIELHDFFSSSSNTEQNRLLDNILSTGIRKREIVNVSGYDVPVLPKL